MSVTQKVAIWRPFAIHFNRFQTEGEAAVGVVAALAAGQTGKACLNSACAGPQGETPQGVS
ncbi:MAG: hypothetical protein ACK5M5_16185 [Limnobaculum xujianqingii]